MTTKTDLTEHQDFSRENESGFIYTEINNSIRIDELVNSDKMSFEEYRKILTYESVFGKRRHFTDAIEVFRKPDCEWRVEMYDHCQRCGKLFRAPWKRRYDLCPECDDILEGKIPWKPEVKVMQRNTTKDIFRLR